MSFFENHKVLNPEKWHYLITNKDIANESINLGNKILHAKVEQKLIGLIIDIDLKVRFIQSWLSKRLTKS